MPSPSTTLDYNAYPQLFEAVVSHADHATRLKLRLLGRRADAYITSLLYGHIELHDGKAELRYDSWGLYLDPGGDRDVSLGSYLVVFSVNTQRPIAVRSGRQHPSE
ncbi:hypothetical protein Q8F55_002977 [Vanrija albida]|uniref:Uncharacterized protein n=1 Tax=Vanrija albida TaxID=181172 RepID=A0ABR3QBU4_9TREE